MKRQGFVRELSQKEREELELIYKTNKDTKIVRNAQIILLSNKGYLPKDIANLVMVHVSTVYRHIEKFNKMGIKSLFIRKIAGRLPKGDKNFMELLSNTVDKEPRDLGFEFSNWTTRTLALYMKEKTKIEVSPRTIERYLKKMGYALKRPKRTVKTQDPQYEEKKGALKKLIEEANKGKIALMFVDEADIDLLPGITRCWTKKGEQKNVSTFGKNEKRYVFGGVDVITGETIHLIRESKRSFDFVDFLFLVKSKYPNGATICLDNSAIHKSKVTAEFLEKDDKIRLFFLPKYSPGLNGMECIWRYMRHRVTYNYFFGTINRLIEAVDNFFNYLSSGQSLRLVYSSAAFR